MQVAPCCQICRHSYTRPWGRFSDDQQGKQSCWYGRISASWLVLRGHRLCSTTMTLPQRKADGYSRHPQYVAMGKEAGARLLA